MFFLRFPGKPALDILDFLPCSLQHSSRFLLGTSRNRTRSLQDDGDYPGNPGGQIAKNQIFTFWILTTYLLYRRIVFFHFATSALLLAISK